MPAQERVTLVVAARDQTRAVLRRIRNAFRGLRVSIGGAFAALGGAAIGRSLLQGAESLENASRRLNIPTERLEQWRNVLKDFGVETQSTDTIFQRLRTNLGRLQTDFPTLRQLYTQSILRPTERLEQLNPEELLLRFADATKAAIDSGDPGRIARNQALLARFVDTEGVRAIGAFALGAERLQAALAAAPTTAPDAIAAMAERSREFRDNMDRATASMQELVNNVLPDVESALTTLNQLVENLNDIREGRVIQGDVFDPIGLRENQNSSVGTAAFDAASALRESLSEAKRSRAVLEQIRDADTGSEGARLAP